MIRFIFALNLLLSAVLLFGIQPMIAKSLLPYFGGSPSVWTLCMLFFQFMLLSGYFYAYLLSKLKNRYWIGIHSVLFLSSFFVFPFFPAGLWESGSPEWRLLLTLFTNLSLPLLIISASAPLLQFAYSQTREKDASDPYHLYVASNIGSLFILFLYPWLIERFFSLTVQFYGWNVLYGVYILFLMVILYGIKYHQTQPEMQTRVASKKYGYWILVSFIPCNLMLSLTFYISTDIAATPLLWLVPLGLYLLSFILTFAKKPIISQQWLQQNSLVFLAILIGQLFFLRTFHFTSGLLFTVLILNILAFFIFAILCHGELAQSRPAVKNLTAFYLCLSLGGVLAGIFNGLLAPLIFTNPYEFPLAIILTLYCIHIPQKKAEWMPFLACMVFLLIHAWLADSNWVKQMNLLVFLALFALFYYPRSRRSLFLGLAACLLVLYKPWYKQESLLNKVRNFYGIKTVVKDNKAHYLINQTTVHGLQLLQDKKRAGNIAYYDPVIPVITALRHIHNPLDSLVIGLGTGIIACQLERKDTITFIEIDEQVINIAKTPSLFSFLKDCPPAIKIVQGDGRLSFSQFSHKKFDLIVLDAFSSDAIPVHLLTKEALELYKKTLSPAGVILVHISNRYLDLMPVITAGSLDSQFTVLFKRHLPNLKKMQFGSDWALITANQKLATLMTTQGWQRQTASQAEPWTDNYSNIVPLLRF